MGVDAGGPPYAAFGRSEALEDVIQVQAKSVPVTVVVAVRNEARNLPRCLDALQPAKRVVVLDSRSEDLTVSVALDMDAEVLQFDYAGGYPKKRQWALENVEFATEWILFVDADEVVTDSLWAEIALALGAPSRIDGFAITKGFHFLGKRFRFGGFSHSAVVLVRRGQARFEKLFDDNVGGLDMEVHERVIVNGEVALLHEPLIHEDFKGLEAYIDRHNRYSTWEARLRHRFLTTGIYGDDTIESRLFGNPQERRRFLKQLVIRVPFEQWVWFFYHYFFRMGLLEGRAGLIACQIRMSYIAQVRAKVFEMMVRPY